MRVFDSPPSPPPLLGSKSAGARNFWGPAFRLFAVIRHNSPSFAPIGVGIGVRNHSAQDAVLEPQTTGDVTERRPISPAVSVRRRSPQAGLIRQYWGQNEGQPFVDLSPEMVSTEYARLPRSGDTSGGRARDAQEPVQRRVDHRDSALGRGRAECGGGLASAWDQ